jgi:hypothetical protein
LIGRAGRTFTTANPNNPLTGRPMSGKSNAVCNRHAVRIFDAISDFLQSQKGPSLMIYALACPRVAFANIRRAQN